MSSALTVLRFANSANLIAFLATLRACASTYALNSFLASSLTLSAPASLMILPIGATGFKKHGKRFT